MQQQNVSLVFLQSGRSDISEMQHFCLPAPSICVEQLLTNYYKNADAMPQCSKTSMTDKTNFITPFTPDFGSKFSQNKENKEGIYSNKENNEIVDTLNFRNRNRNSVHHYSCSHQA
jgi:hypothetical protein